MYVGVGVGLGTVAVILIVAGYALNLVYEPIGPGGPKVTSVDFVHYKFAGGGVEFPVGVVDQSMPCTGTLLLSVGFFETRRQVYYSCHPGGG